MSISDISKSPIRPCDFEPVRNLNWCMRRLVAKGECAMQLFHIIFFTYFTTIGMIGLNFDEHYL